MNRGLTIVVFFTAMLCGTATGSYAQYVAVDLGTLGGPGSQAIAVNDSGQVVGISGGHGFSWTAWGGMVDIGAGSLPIAVNAAGQVVGSFNTGGTLHAFSWTAAGGLVDLGSFGGNSVATAVSATGQVVGSSSFPVPGNGGNHAFSWTAAGGLVDLGTLGGTSSVALDVNDSGQVVGASDDAGGNTHAFSWTAAGGMVDLGTLGGQGSWAVAVNALGQVAGYSSTANGKGHAFLWTATGGMVDLGSIGGSSSSRATAVNDAGQVVGVSNSADNSKLNAFSWTAAGGMVDLGGLGDLYYSPAAAVNATGQVVGTSYSIDLIYYDDATLRAFSWTAAGGLVDLGTLGGANSQAVAVNAAGLIVGVSNLAGDNANPLGTCCAHATLWIPVGVATTAGSNVTVSTPTALPTGGVSTVALAFDSVITPGTTTVVTGSVPQGGAPDAPSNFKVGEPPVYYDVDTTAVFTGTIMLCFSWQEGQFANESAIDLFHYENGNWLDVTASRDTVANTVCGQVSSLSPFGLFETSYTFTGFYQPVDNPPTRNSVKAGSAVPVRFSLSGNQGLAVIGTGYPASQQTQCDTNAPISAIEETSTAGASSLSYDASSGRYTYVWKTEKAWANSCRQLIVRFNDGTQRTANFKFAK